ERAVRRVGAAGGRGLRDDAGVRGLHRRGARGRRRRDGLGLLRGAQEPPRPERGHRPRQRVPDRALRRSGAGAPEPRPRPDADEPAVLAGRRGDDADRDADGVVSDERRPLGLVRRGARADGVPHLRDDAVPAAAPSGVMRVLEPIERVQEVLFGLIMVLTFTGSLSVAEAGREDVRTMLIGALGCNLAWGLIDAVFYLMGCLADSGRRHASFRAAREAADPAEARRLVAEAMPPVVARVLEPAELD